jgi:hypothetical protein
MVGKLSKCPSCNYCGFTDYLGKMLEQEPVCPMCDAQLTAAQLETIKPENQNSYLKSISFGNIDEPGKSGAD